MTQHRLFSTPCNVGDDEEDDYEDDSDDDDVDDIDPDTMKGLQALAAQLLQEGGLEDLDVKVEGEKGPAAPGSSRRGGGKGSDKGRQGSLGEGRSSSSRRSSNSSVGGVEASKPKSESKDPFEVRGL